MYNYRQAPKRTTNKRRNHNNRPSRRSATAPGGACVVPRKEGFGINHTFHEPQSGRKALSLLLTLLARSQSCHRGNERSRGGGGGDYAAAREENGDC